MANNMFLALDLGAESGRGLLGAVSDKKIELTELHRFSNGPVRTGDELHWDTLRLWSEMKQALALAFKKTDRLAGVGIDTWGVDFGLLARDGQLLGNPFHYRDARTNGILEKAFAIVEREKIFECTGVQFMQLNTLFQLLAMRLQNSPLLEAAETMLLMPDLFNYWFTGRKCAEFTIATTTQAYDPRQGRWADELIEKLGLPRRIFPEIVPTGTVLGPVCPDIREELGATDVPVICSAEHDTGSAVAAVPAVGGKRWAFLSSGTWSLMGTEVDKPVINEHAQRFNFTNEGCFGGTFRFLKNILGLWLIQECRRTWEREGTSYSYDQLATMAAEAEPFLAILNPDDPSFLAPGDMPSRIAEFCRRTGQQGPKKPGQFVRVCLEGLAMSYRQTLERIEICTGRSIEVLHAVGGGIQNTQLSQWTADVLGRTVIAGPIEATATGNIAIQAIAAGVLADLPTARRVIARSFEPVVYEPADSASWEKPYKQFEQLRA